MFFFDTYALFEIIKGNSKYAEFVDKSFITTRLNLMDLYYSLLRILNKEKAEYYYNMFLPASVSVSDEIIKYAMQFRLQHKELISYIDCVAYMAALEKDCRFVTGEKHFLGLRNVEFVR